MSVREGLRILPGAARDITEIWQFINEPDPRAALRVVDQILNAVRSLVAFPHRGHRRTDLTSKPLRFQTVYDYLIAYDPDETPLAIVAVFHGRRNPRVIAAMLRERSE